MEAPIIRSVRAWTSMRWLVAAIFVIGIVGVSALFKEDKHTQEVVQDSPPRPLPVAPNSSSVQSAKVSTASKAPPKQVAETGLSSKAAEFDALVKSGNASDAFAAYKLLLSCWLAPATCGDLTAGQRTQAYQLLNQAVAAHIPKAAVYLAVTTPDGRAPFEVYGDPAYDDWRAHARREVEDAANRGDKAALLQMFSFALSENMPDRALMYFTAYADTPPIAGQDFVSSQLEALSQGLPPEQAAAAIAEGHAFAKTTQK